MKYGILWDNGASDCGEFPWRFPSWESADAYGKDWADEANLRDFGTTDPDEDCYTYEVIECPMEDDDLTDEEKDAHEGAEHIRMRDREQL